MDPYDRRAVRAVWARVSPERDVFAMGQGGKPPVSQRPDAAQNVADTLATLAAEYDRLACRMRSPMLRQMAAQCRRALAQVQKNCAVRGSAAHSAQVSFAQQCTREAELRQGLEDCSGEWQQLIRESDQRSRTLTRMR